MADPVKRRLEILDETTRLSKLQKEAIRKARLKNGSPFKEWQPMRNASGVSHDWYLSWLGLGEVGT